MAWMALAALLAAGCKTATVEQTTVTEVALPARQPFALPSEHVETNTLVTFDFATNAVTNVVVPIPTNGLSVGSGLRTNAPAPSRLVAPPGGWLPLQTWCQAGDLGLPQKLSSGAWAVGTRTGSLVVQPGSQMARWDGTQVWLGFAPKFVSGQLCLHWLDVQKVLEPLRQRVPPVSKPDRVLVLDPGHGGVDGGTVGSNKQIEKHLTLDWALRIQTLLQTNGWKVFLTRTADIDLPLSNRVAFAEQVGADLFVSLHFNGLNAQAKHSGIETFCLTPLGMPSSVTRGYEDNVRQEFPNNAYDQDNLWYAYRLHRELLSTTRATDGGLRHARFMGVLRGQRRPAVLIEGGFLSNPDEARRLGSASYRQKLAEAVARALSP